MSSTNIRSPSAESMVGVTRGLYRLPAVFGDLQRLLVSGRATCPTAILVAVLGRGGSRRRWPDAHHQVMIVLSC